MFFMNIPSTLEKWKHHITRRLKEEFANRLSPREERLRWASDKSNSLWKVRMKSVEMLEHRGISIGRWFKYVDYKCKPGEILEQGKNLRGIGDLTNPGSCVAAYMMDWVKNAFREYNDQGYLHYFCKSPERSELCKVYTALLKPELACFTYFSDDSCVSVRCTDGVFKCNMDIKACDGSNFKPIFDFFEEILTFSSPYQDDAARLFDQLRSDFVVRNPGGKEKIRFTQDGANGGSTLFSGSSYTTTANNVANTCISMAFKERLLERDNLTMAEVPEMLRRAAYSCGFLVKIFPQENASGLQFLKTSPAFDEQGNIVPQLNLGTILRSFGTFRGDYPGRGELGKRVELFNSEVVRSYRHAGNNDVLNAFRRRFILPERMRRTRDKRVSESLQMKITGENVEYVGTRWIEERYGCTSVEVDEFCELILRSEYHEIYARPIIDKIMSVDYGYASVL